MSLFDITSQILGIIVAGTLIFWLGFFVRLLRMTKDKPTIREGLSIDLDDFPLVSIIVPAHNEERVINRCAEALRAQSYENVQIIFVLDRCIDSTLDILTKHASEDERVTIIENDSCPDDWAGKCNAARLGSESAKGDWLLFSDADTKFDKDLVRCAIASATKRGASLLSLLSSLTTDNFFEKVVQPVASTFLIRLYPVDRVNRKENPRPFANGQFLLFKRDAYESIGGHHAVHEALLEDIAFAKAIHNNGNRVQILFADGMLAVSMYANYDAFKEGWKRIYIEACHRNVKRLRESAVISLLFNIGFPLAAIAGIVVGQMHSPILLWTAVASLFMYGVNVSWLYKMNHASPLFVLFAPIGGVAVAGILFGAAHMLTHRIPIKWGGRSYILEPTNQ